MGSKSVEDTVEAMRNGSEVPFRDLAHVCEHYFGKPRINGSHHIFKMPWAGNPRINIQSTKGNAKRYQVRQVLAALDALADFILAQRKAAEKAAADKKAAEKPAAKKK